MIEKIYKLSREVFEDDIYLAMKFNEAINDENYGRAKVVVDALKHIYPNSLEVIELDELINKLIK